MRRSLIALALLAVSSAASAQTRSNATMKNVTPAASAVKIYTITTIRDADTVFTDRQGCSASVLNNWAVIVGAEVGDPTGWEYATVYFGGHEGKHAGEVEYDDHGKQYDLTREIDPINAKCVAFLKAIPSEKVRKLVAHLIIE